MARRPNNALSTTISLPERLSDGSYLPLDKSFRDYAQVQLQVLAEDFVSDTSLRQLRADYERDLQDLRKPAVAAFEKLEAEKRQKRLDEAAARRKEILAEALGKAAARNTGGESSINSNAGANAKPKIRRGKAGDPSAPEQTAVSEPAASPQPLQAEIPKLLEGPVGSSSPSTAGTTETPP